MAKQQETQLPASGRILGMRVDLTNYADAADRVCRWARRGESRYVCVANVHMTMEAHDSKEYLHVVNSADLVTPDGMPLVWGLKLLGMPQATRVKGPSLMRHLLARVSGEDIPVGFLGSTPEVLGALEKALATTYSGVRIAYSYSPPFRPLLEREQAAIIDAIMRSKTAILFVGLGCPNQEKWMAAHRGKLNSVMIGVGAAFEFLAGTKPEAPPFVQGIGFEWLFRLISEPRRLWRRYARTNPRFLALFARQLLQHGLGKDVARNQHA